MSSGLGFGLAREAAATGRGGTKVKTAEYSPAGEGEGGGEGGATVRLKR